MPDETIIDIQGYRFRDREANEEKVPAEVPELSAGQTLSARGIIGHEEAFLVYAGDGGRSMRKTARLLGIPEGTVLSWGSRHNWRQRMLDADFELVEGAVETGGVVLMSQYLENIKALIAIRDNKKSSPMAITIAIKELNRMQERVMELAMGRMVASKLSEELEDDELEQLASTPEGIAKLLQMQRERTGRA